jgi:predicted esterase
MSRNLISRVLPIGSGLVLAVALALPARGQTGLAGRVLEKVTCEADDAQSYALYLPSHYDASRRWPIVYCFDPRARGARAIEPFRDGAEKFGYILVGSNNSRNGPFAANKTAIDAMLRDTQTRLAVDPRRIYTAGLSGGARVAVAVALSGLTQGVIACSGGFPGEIPKQVPFPLFGTTGIDDSNYDEMRRIDEELDQRATPHRVAIFAGGHEWPPSTLGREAIEWLEIHAMRAGLRARDESMIEAAFQARLQAMPASPPQAWLETKSLAADFKGLRDTSGLERRAREMASSREVGEWRKQERRAEDHVQRRFDEIVEAAMTGSAHALLGTVDALRKQTNAPTDSTERRISRRAFLGAQIYLEQTARGLVTAQDNEKAATLFGALLAMQPERTGLYFDLARMRALAGRTKTALADLRQAVAAGYSDVERVEKEEAFKALRREEAYREILAGLKENAAADKPAQKPR